ncbi:hypothetical protein [Bradyrhizobium liaoningense]|uniref:hypothetical protein n=1 Tax=Bradyrhizobium liaoningense TaxID=43992 RepID=UPI001BA4EC64|nr:hypothetical protein [Bradyrhizobium liaoningense]MBR0901697.1 hypothetical protein [Bradyrhizobium liaoningense]
MSSRALSLATVLLLIGFGAADTVLAQATNLEAGKTPSQLFAQTCNVCHKSPRGLLKSVAPGSLPGFLRQHYTTSSDMAGVLASYLVSNGATDTRYQAKDGKKDANAAPGQSPEHQGRRQRSQDAAKDGVSPEGQAAPEGRKSKRRAKPEDASKAESAAPASDDKKGESKPETVKPDSAKVEPEAKPEGAKAEPRGSEAAAPRPDPVPQATPAAPTAAPKPAEEAAPRAAAPAASSEPTPAAKPQESAPPATAAAPPAPPADSSRPPAPPISR